jgi:hypothetical protein
MEGIEDVEIEAKKPDKDVTITVTLTRLQYEKVKRKAGLIGKVRESTTLKTFITATIGNKLQE